MPAKKKEETTLSLRQKMVYIQGNLVSTKKLKNKFGNYNYRSAESILADLRPLLKETNTAIVLEDEMANFGTVALTADDKTKTYPAMYIRATAMLVDGDSEQIMQSVAYAKEGFDKKGMDPAQLSGSTSSYARKYALQGLFGMDNEEDPDAHDARTGQTTAEKKTPAKKTTTPKKVNMNKVIDETNKYLTENYKAGMDDAEFNEMAKGAFGAASVDIADKKSDGYTAVRNAIIQFKKQGEE